MRYFLQPFEKNSQAEANSIENDFSRMSTNKIKLLYLLIIFVHKGMKVVPKKKKGFQFSLFVVNSSKNISNEKWCRLNVPKGAKDNTRGGSKRARQQEVSSFWCRTKNGKKRLEYVLRMGKKLDEGWTELSFRC